MIRDNEERYYARKKKKNIYDCPKQDPQHLAKKSKFNLFKAQVMK